MADEFKVGDRVKSKSGTGPTMVIDSLGVRRQGSTTQGAYCSWFDEKNKPQNIWLPLTSLQKVKADESGFYSSPSSNP
jgi:uncharacterized protein YodC (DUF2158 family)